jgi:hypothetical protein
VLVRISGASKGGSENENGLIGNICTGGQSPPVDIVENAANDALNGAGHAVQNHVLKIPCPIWACPNHVLKIPCPIWACPNHVLKIPCIKNPLY